MTDQSLPPAPAPGQPVTVPLSLLPEWLDHHNLMIVRYDGDGRYYTAPRPIPAGSAAPVTPPRVDK